MADTPTAVLLLAFGTPRSLDSMEEFLGNVMKGRKPTPRQVEEVKKKYAAIGGRSPLNEIVGDQMEALGKTLEEKCPGQFRVYAGMRFWTPFIKESLQKIHDDGIKKVIAVNMAPQYSGYSVGGYRNAIEEALESLDLPLEVSLVTECCYNKKYLQALAEKVRMGLEDLPEGERLVIFSAHSIPRHMMPAGDPYEKQLGHTIEGLLKITGPLRWKFGYQSKGYAPGDWLGPSIDSLLEESAKESWAGVLVVPIGFLSDHVETLYDIDIEYGKKAQDLKLCFRRSPSLNADPLFIEGLAEGVLEKSKE